MPTCLPNLTHSFLTVWKIITFKVDKKVFFYLRPKGTVEFWRRKNCYFFWIYMDPNYGWVRYLSTKSHIHKKCGTLRKKHFLQGSILKFTYKGRFLTIKKTYKKLLYWKFKWWTYTFVLPLHIDFFFFGETTRSQFLVAFQSSSS